MNRAHFPIEGSQGSAQTVMIHEWGHEQELLTGVV